jgi:hypothetical protein
MISSCGDSRPRLSGRAKPGNVRVECLKGSGFIRRGASLSCSSRVAGPSKLKLTRPHIDFPPAKPHALGLETQSLLHCRVPLQLDRTARPQHPLPRQSESAAQNRRNLPRRPRKSSRPRHPAVGRHFPPRNRANRPLDPHTHLTGFIRAILIDTRSAPCRHQVHSLRDDPGAPSLPRTLRQRRGF